MADGDLDDPTDYGSVVRNNLMKRPGYAPYCMASNCWCRMEWTGSQFRHCGQATEFPADFIEKYKERWKK